MLPALQQVAAEGWEDEARLYAEAALTALGGGRQQPDDPAYVSTCDHKHVMLSYQWNHQQVATRIVAELKVRGYTTWCV